jgi:hypothetical protein
MEERIQRVSTARRDRDPGPLGATSRIGFPAGQIARSGLYPGISSDPGGPDPQPDHDSGHRRGQPLDRHFPAQIPERSSLDRPGGLHLGHRTEPHPGSTLSAGHKGCYPRLDDWINCRVCIFDHHRQYAPLPGDRLRADRLPGTALDFESFDQVRAGRTSEPDF